LKNLSFVENGITEASFDLEILISVFVNPKSFVRGEC